MGIFDGVLIASDLDGTLLGADHTLSPENRAALESFMREGGRFSIATGRSPSGVEWLRPWEFSNAPAVLSNGGIIYDYTERKTLFIDRLSRETIAATMEMARAFPEAGVEIHCVENKWVINRNEEIDIHMSYVHYDADEVSSMEAAVGEPWLKVLFVDKPELVTRIGDWAKARYGDRISLVYSNQWMLEIQNRGIDKGFGVKKLAKLLGAKERHVYTVGDAGNDFEMMLAFESFAPANADDEIKRAADHLLPDCEDHAVAAMIEILKERYGGAAEK